MGGYNCNQPSYQSTNPLGFLRNVIDRAGVKTFHSILLLRLKVSVWHTMLQTKNKNKKDIFVHDINWVALLLNPIYLFRIAGYRHYASSFNNITDQNYYTTTSITHKSTSISSFSFVSRWLKVGLSTETKHVPSKCWRKHIENSSSLQLMY